MGNQSQKDLDDIRNMPPAAAIEGLTTALGNATESIERGKRNQRGLLIVIVVMIAALVWMWSIAGDAKDAASKATHAAAQAHVAQVQSCLNGNQTRASLTAFFLSLIDAPPQAGAPPKTDAQKELALLLHQYTVDSFAPRDCTDLTKKYTPVPVPDQLKP